MVSFLCALEKPDMVRKMNSIYSVGPLKESLCYQKVQNHS
jgi:hypothetical protein